MYDISSTYVSWRIVYMQIEQLNYIISVAAKGNISKASKELSISQSALSQSIIKLEKEINVQIFNRHRSGVTVTKNGQFIIDSAIEIIKKTDQLINLTNNINNNVEKITIGVIEGLHFNFIPKLFSKLKETFIHTDFEFIELSSLNICKELLNKNLDLGVLAIYDETRKYTEKINCIKIKKINMYAFLSKESDLASKKNIYPSDLKNKTFITYNGEYMNWFFSKYKKTYGDFEELITTKNNHTINKAVKDNLAIAIEVEEEITNKEYIDTGDIIAKPLVLNESFYKDFIGIGYLYNKDSTLDKNKKKLIEMLRNELSHF